MRGNWVIRWKELNYILGTISGYVVGGVIVWYNGYNGEKQCVAKLVGEKVIKD